MGTATDPQVRETFNLISSDKVEGTSVRNSSGETIGEIERLMINKRSGKVAYAIMSFGGFLGIGEEYYPIPWEKLAYNPELDAYQLDLDLEQLKNAPKFADEGNFNWSSTESRRVDDFYGVNPI
jgi:hypothetical protein